MTRSLDQKAFKMLKNVKMSDRATDSQKEILAGMTKRAAISARVQPRKVVNYATEFKS
jgi:ABC-type nitrate/sulfonate/bicarbonate transport system ATPase subunit